MKTASILLILFALIPAVQIFGEFHAESRPTAFPAQNRSGPDLDPLKKYISQYLDWYDLPGLAIGLVKDGKIVLVKGYGRTNLPDGGKVTENTVFSTASVTKLFVGTALMQLFEQGKLDLKAPVTRYLSFFKLGDPRDKEITVTQLLNHTSGLPDDEGEEFISSWKKPEFDDAALLRYVKGLSSKPLLSPPGETYRYTNIGYEILGAIVEEISGRPLEDYINAKILSPLGMKHSNMLLARIDPTRLARPHVLDATLKFKESEYFPYTRRHSASGTLLSTVADMSLFAAAILNGGARGEARIIADSSLKKMWSPENDNPAGLSWHVTKVDEKTTLVFHAGGDPGFRTELILIPEKALGVVVMTNSWEHQIEPLAYKALNVMMGDPEEDSFTAAHGTTWKIIRENAADEAQKKIRDFVSGIGLEKFHPAVLNQHANLLQECGRKTEAVEWKRLNLELYPENFQLWNSLAESCLAAGDTPGAIAAYEKSLAFRPENNSARERLQSLKTNKRAA